MNEYQRVVYFALPPTSVAGFASMKIDINSTMSKIDVDLSSVVLLSDTTETLLRNFSQAVQLDYQGFQDESCIDDLLATGAESLEATHHAEGAVDSSDGEYVYASDTACMAGSRQVMATRHSVQLEKNTTKAGNNLTDFIRRVREAANDSSTSPTAKTKLNAEADKLSTLNGGLLSDTTQNQKALLVDVNTLNATTKNVSTDVDNMIASTKASEKYIHDEGSGMVKQVTKDLMGCKPVWNLWESIVHGAICGHGVQTMNGFWFALGWSVFFMFFGMIFSVKTAKYFRKMK
ncbi:hypothetical protein LSAT2_019445 [Lamellibrachia satsuma]|nr:hypothetical protein LSAT2_019445 [Lamellibrachia satsuma]